MHVTLRPIVPYLVVAGVTIAVLSISIPAHQLIIGGDETAPELDPAITLAHISNAWNAAAGLGSSSALWRPLLFPVVAIDAALRALGASAVAVNHFWLYFFALSQALLTVQLFRQLFPSARAPIASVYCGIAAFLNPFILIWMHSPYPSTQLGITVLPGLLAAMIWYVRTGMWLAFVEFVVLSFFQATSWVNPGVFMIAFAPFLLTCLALLVGLRLRGAALRLAPLLLVYVAANVLWALPIYDETVHILHRRVELQETYSLETLHSVSQYSGLANSARLVGEYLFFNPIGKRLYLPSGPSYEENPVVVIGTLGLPLLALAGFVLGRRFGVIRTIVVVGAAALFGAKGSASPLGGIFEWVILHFAPLMALRDSFNKFEWIVLLAYVLLAGYALDHIWSHARRGPALALTAAAFALLAVGGYPFLRGELFWKQLRVAVPARYTSMASWLNANAEEGRVLAMPVAPVLFDIYTWGYFGSSLNANLLARPLLGRVYDLGLEGNTSLDDLMQHFRVSVGTSRVSALLGLYGFRYILSDPTINPNGFGPNQTDSVVARLPGTVIAHRASSLSLLEIDDGRVNPTIYAPRQIVTGPQDLQEEAIACATLGSCKDVAILNRRVANQFIAGCCTAFAFEPADRYDLFHPQSGMIMWLRPALAEDAPPPAVDLSAAGAVVDYGNMTTLAVLARSQQPRLLYGGNAALSIAPTSRTALATGFEELMRISHSITLCALAHETRLVTIPLPAALHRGDLAILNLTVSPTPLNVEASVVDLGDPIREFTEPIGDAFAGGQLSRVFRAAGAGSEYALNLYGRGVGRSGCATVDDVTFGRANDPSAWRLLGSPTNLYATPPYLARYPDIMARHTDAPLRPADARLSGERKVISSFTAAWSAAESASPQGSAWDWHAAFVHLLPGAEYRLSLPLQLMLGNKLRIALYSQNGQYLGSLFPSPARRAQKVSVPVFLPEDSTELVVYVYLDGRNGGLKLLMPRLVLLSGGALYVRRSALTNVARPRSIRLSKTASGWDVAVTDAPPRYVLVFTGSFDPRWTLQAPPGVRAQHEIANLFTNAWLIHGSGDYRLSLQFTGNRYVTIAYFLCATLLFLGAAAFSLLTALQSSPARRNGDGTPIDRDLQLGNLRDT